MNEGFNTPGRAFVCLSVTSRIPWSDVFKEGRPGHLRPLPVGGKSLGRGLKLKGKRAKRERVKGQREIEENDRRVTENLDLFNRVVLFFRLLLTFRTAQSK